MICTANQDWFLYDRDPRHERVNLYVLLTFFSLDLFQFLVTNPAQKMTFSIQDFLSKCYQTRSFLEIWSHLLKKFLMESFMF